MRTPAFWQHDGVAARLLQPAASMVAAMTARRVAQPGWRAPVPVLCCGNAGVGGAGKTTLVLDLAARLIRRGIAVHLLSRGYGGRVSGPVRVDPDRHDATFVGDEPLLLARVAPTWVGADRAASARDAVAAGAQALLMDDGLQNGSLDKTASLLVVDGGAGFGNRRVMPAGPLREPVRAAVARCRAAVLIGADVYGAAAALAPLPVLRAGLRPTRDLAGWRVLALCGIASPAKFLATVREAGAELAGEAAFADHHRFSPEEVAAVQARAERLGAVVLTTAKDAARLGTAGLGFEVLGVRLAWADEAAVERLLDEVLAR